MSEGGVMVDSNVLHLGIDLGSFNIKALLCNTNREPLRQICAPSRGKLKTSLLQVFKSLLSEFPNTLQLKVAVTGSGQSALKGLEAALFVNEVLATALGASYLFKGARTVVDVGGQFSKWILLDCHNPLQVVVVDFASNGLCAAGAGAFLEQQAHRLDLTVESLGRLAAAAPRGARIAGRCSVFAKSDMIHLQQKGTPIDEIALGVCQAMARTFCSTISRRRKMESPVLLVGGGAANPGFVRAFREISGVHPK